jgi:hypothetical protein
MADDDTDLSDPSSYDLIPVDHTPQFADAPSPKAGQTIQQPNVMGDITSMPGKVAQTVGDVTGVSDAYKAATGQMTPDEAQMFALGALPMLAGGPEAKAVEGVAEDIAPTVAKGIRAYHGSPYDFNQFDLSKIGTGEGAQAYGHGLYFAENPQTATTYRATQQILNTPENIAAAYLDRYELPEKAAKAIKEDILRATDDANFQQHGPGALALLQSGQEPKPGKMYEVNINADPEHFLDWDKPLSEQSPKVQEALQGILPKGDVSPQGLDMGGGGQILDNRNGKVKPGSSAPWILKSGDSLFDLSQKDVDRMVKGQTGEAAYTRLTASLGSQSAATQALHDAGIPGLRYLDQGSRAAGDGTRNYVVFNHDLVNIVKKYGLAGLVAGGASHFSTVPVDHQPDFGDNQQGMATGGRIDGATSINRKYDVPYLAGSSDDDKTVYIDRRVPKRIAVKRANGKGYESIDPAEFLAEHEREEHKAMRAGKSYEKAHVENGTAAERAKVEAHGLDWRNYTEKMDGMLSHIEHEHPKKPPPDLFTKPYPHREATLLKNLGHERAT